MFRILSIVLIIGSLIWFFIFLNKNKRSFSKVVSDYLSSLIKSLGDIKYLKSQNISTNLEWFRRIVYFFTLFLFFLMAISAFIPLILFNESLSGFFLLVHVALAPVFSIFLAILVLIFAHSNRFSKDDLVKSYENDVVGKKMRLNISGYIKLIFWLVAIFSIPAMVSIILSMFPFFGTEGQLYLLKIHRFSTLIILLLVIFHSGLISVQSE